MATRGHPGARGAEPTDGVLARSPKVDELCRLVGRIVSADQEVVNKIDMCAELKRRRAQEPGSDCYEGKRHQVEDNVKELEFYWNEMMGVDQSAVSFADFFSHVKMSHCGRNRIAHCSIASKEGLIKNVEKRRAYSKDDLGKQLEKTWLALRDSNKIYKHVGLGDYNKYLEPIQPK